ncbi:hypothetical protein [Luteibaculum oceani]|uniref:Uncharacterized protein n=1 Tax=Luteibaculum oceani TaxID=1294296 RepID=A0A5C6VA69_9FLAO|nr:hypothetical protein [Luteibaculum oceani]TXC81664.1 hypothetical protein FRX97_03875 [Luteibaculum oceani]
MKKALSYMLAGMVFIFTVIAILSIWEVITIEDVLWKSLKTLLVLFVASAIVTFILQVTTDDKEKNSGQSI